MASSFQLYSHLLSKYLDFACIALFELFCFQEMLQCPKQLHQVLAQGQSAESLRLLLACRNSQENARLNCQYPFFLFFCAQSKILPCTMGFALNSNFSLA